MCIWVIITRDMLASEVHAVILARFVFLSLTCMYVMSTLVVDALLSLCAFLMFWFSKSRGSLRSHNVCRFPAEGQLDGRYAQRFRAISTSG